MSSTSSTASPSGSSSSTTPTLSPTSSNTSASGSATSSSTSTSSADGSSNTGGLGAPSSSLYLFTFLATLFLLLAISSAIIMRGIFLRRRFRRRMEEAIAAGAFLSDDGSGGFGGVRTPRRKLQRPTLYDVSVLPPYFSTSSPQDGSWEKVMPFAGSVSTAKPGLEPPSPDSGLTPRASPPRHGHREAIRNFLIDTGMLMPRARLRRPNAPAPSERPYANAGLALPMPMPSSGSGSGDAATTPAVPLEPVDPLDRAEEVRVAVVIAMPNPRRSGYVPPPVDAELHLYSPGGKSKARGLDGWTAEEGEETGVPDVVLGTARTPLAGAGTGAGAGAAEGADAT